MVVRQNQANLPRLVRAPHVVHGNPPDLGLNLEQTSRFAIAFCKQLPCGKSQNPTDSSIRKPAP